MYTLPHRPTVEKEEPQEPNAFLRDTQKVSQVDGRNLKARRPFDKDTELQMRQNATNMTEKMLAKDKNHGENFEKESRERFLRRENCARTTTPEFFVSLSFVHSFCRS